MKTKTPSKTKAAKAVQETVKTKTPTKAQARKLAPVLEEAMAQQEVTQKAQEELTPEQLKAKREAEFLEGLKAGVQIAIDGAVWKIEGPVAQELASAQNMVGKAYGFYRKQATTIGEIFNAPTCFDTPDSTEAKALFAFLCRINQAHQEWAPVVAALKAKENRTEQESAAFAGARFLMKEAERVVNNTKSRLFGYWLDAQEEAGTAKKAKPFSKITSDFLAACARVVKADTKYSTQERERAALMAQAVEKISAGLDLGLQHVALPASKAAQAPSKAEVSKPAQQAANA